MCNCESSGWRHRSYHTGRHRPTKIRSVEEGDGEDVGGGWLGIRRTNLPQGGRHLPIKKGPHIHRPTDPPSPLSPPPVRTMERGRRGEADLRHGGEPLLDVLEDPQARPQRRVGCRAHLHVRWVRAKVTVSKPWMVDR